MRVFRPAPLSACLFAAGTGCARPLLHGRRQLHGGGAAAHSVTAAELRAALETLGLAESCSDDEVKQAFQAFAKRHHPDLQSPGGSGGSGGGGERMRRGTEAYQLLRRTDYHARRMVLREGGARRRWQDRRGPGSASGDEEMHAKGYYTEEELRRARAAYAGSRGASSRLRRRREQERAREAEARAAYDASFRRYQYTTPYATSSSSSPSSGSGGGGGAPARLAAALRAAARRVREDAAETRRAMAYVRDRYRADHSFAGMDGSRYSAAHKREEQRQEAEEMAAAAAGGAGEAGAAAASWRRNPSMVDTRGHYDFLKRRAQERAHVDAAMRAPLRLLLTLSAVAAAALLVRWLSAQRTRQAARLEEERRQIREGNG